ncbi:MAG: class I SAM-dependent methyltransferase [Nanoarchaeota archaeon]
MTGVLSPLLQIWRFKKVFPWIKKSVLEIGCSNGELLNFLPKSIKYTGIDTNEDFVKKAKELHPEQNFLCFTINEKKEIPVEKFHSIVLLALIEHLEDPLIVLIKLKKHLYPNGKIIITTPSPTSHYILTIGAKLGLFSKEALEEHHNYYTKRDLFNLFNTANFKILHYKQFQFGLNQVIIGEFSK